MLKKSLYNIVLPGPDQNTVLLLNSLSRAFCILPKADADAFCIGNPISHATLNSLVSTCALTNSPEAQQKLAFQLYRDEQKSSRELTVVFPITSDCNMRCVYCYQVLHGAFRGKETGLVPEWTERTISSAVKFVERELEGKIYELIRVRWYGGEPLLRLDLINLIGTRIRQLSSVSTRKMAGTLVTNGLCLDSHAIHILRSLNVDRVEISVDGPSETHNLLRPNRNGTDTYSYVMRSIKLAAEHFDTVIFRVNIHARNATAIGDWLTEIASHIARPNIYLKFKLIEGDQTNSIDWRTFSSLILKYLLVARSLGLQLLDSTLRTELCPATRENYYILQSDLRVYKCPQNLGSDDHVGIITSSGDFQPNWKLHRWTGYTVEKDAACKTCAHLPHCNGGCPYNLIMYQVNQASLRRYHRKEKCCLEKLVPELLTFKLSQAFQIQYPSTH